MIRKSPIRRKELVKVYSGGREVCKIPEYWRRREQMCEWQGQKCAICLLPRVPLCFDHEAGRGLGGGHRDDRIIVNGLRQNAALCIPCNSEKGSKRYAWIDGKYVPVTGCK
jgi:hypothetical protein